MAEMFTQPYFIEPGNDQGERLGEPLCIVRERSEDDRRAVDRLRQVIAKAQVEERAKHGGTM